MTSLTEPHQASPVCLRFSFSPGSLMSLFLQVLGFALILLYTFNVAMPLWRIHQGMPQAPELLLHPTVWLTTMVITACAGAQLAPAPPPLLLSCGAGAWRRWGPWELPLLPPTLSCLELCHLPDSHGEEEGGPGIWGALWVLAALLSPASYRHRPAGLCRGEWGPGEAHRVASNLCSVPFSTRDTLPHKHLPSNVFYYVLN